MPNGAVVVLATAVANTTQLETYRLAEDILVWNRQSASGYNLYARPLNANGQPTGETFTIQETAVNQQNPTIAYGGNGRF